MISSGRCPKCGSTRIAGPHRLHGGDAHVRIDLPGFPTATLEAFTCAECGYSEFYADRVGLDNIRSAGRFVLNAPPPRASHAVSHCPNCRTPVREGTTFCGECGYPLG